MFSKVWTIYRLTTRRKKEIKVSFEFEFEKLLFSLYYDYIRIIFVQIPNYYQKRGERVVYITVSNNVLSCYPKNTGFGTLRSIFGSLLIDVDVSDCF